MYFHDCIAMHSLKNRNTINFLIYLYLVAKNIAYYGLQKISRPHPL